MNRTQLTYFLVGVLALASCSRSLSDYGYKPADQQQLDLVSLNRSDVVHLHQTAVNSYNQSNLLGGEAKRAILFYDAAPGQPVQQVDNAYYYPQEAIMYESTTRWAKVAAQVVMDAQTEPVLNMYVFDTPEDSLVIYGGTEGMVPRVRNDKKGEWLFEGEVALAPTQKDKAKQRERYMKYKLTYSPDQKRPRVQSYKVKTRKTAK